MSVPTLTFPRNETRGDAAVFEKEFATFYQVISGLAQRNDMRDSLSLPDDQVQHRNEPDQKAQATFRVC